MNKKEPFELQYFKFLPQDTKLNVEIFVSKLKQPHKDFAVKRYFEDKTIRVVAEEMDYEERSLYKFRNEIIDLWDMFYFDHKFSYHRRRILLALKRHGKVEYSKLLMNMNLKRSRLSLAEFKDILKSLVNCGEVVCVYSEPNINGRYKKYLALSSKFVQNLSSDSKLAEINEQEYA